MWHKYLSIRETRVSATRCLWMTGLEGMRLLLEADWFVCSFFERLPLND